MPSFWPEGALVHVLLSELPSAPEPLPFRDLLHVTYQKSAWNSLGTHMANRRGARPVFTFPLAQTSQRPGRASALSAVGRIPPQQGLQPLLCRSSSALLPRGHPQSPVLQTQGRQVFPGPRTQGKHEPYPLRTGHFIFAFHTRPVFTERHLASCAAERSRVSALPPRPTCPASPPEKRTGQSGSSSSACSGAQRHTLCM